MSCRPSLQGHARSNLVANSLLEQAAQAKEQARIQKVQERAQREQEKQEKKKAMENRCFWSKMMISVVLPIGKQLVKLSSKDRRKDKKKSGIV